MRRKRNYGKERFKRYGGGTEINLICDGPDEEEALKTLSEAIESGLGE